MLKVTKIKVADEIREIQDEELALTTIPAMQAVIDTQAQQIETLTLDQRTKILTGHQAVQPLTSNVLFDIQFTHLIRKGNLVTLHTRIKFTTGFNGDTDYFIGIVPAGFTPKYGVSYEGVPFSKGYSGLKFIGFLLDDRRLTFHVNGNAIEQIYWYTPIALTYYTDDPFPV